MTAFTATETGGTLAIRVTPRASRTGLVGMTATMQGQPCLQIRLAAPPVDGAANKALLQAVAKALGLPKSKIAIIRGDASREKLLALEGDAEVLARAVADWLAAATSD